MTKLSLGRLHEHASATRSVHAHLHGGRLEHDADRPRHGVDDSLTQGLHFSRITQGVTSDRSGQLPRPLGDRRGGGPRGRRQRRLDRSLPRDRRPARRSRSPARRSPRRSASARPGARSSSTHSVLRVRRHADAHAEPAPSTSVTSGRSRSTASTSATASSRPTTLRTIAQATRARDRAGGVFQRAQRTGRRTASSCTLTITPPDATRTPRRSTGAGTITPTDFSRSTTAYATPRRSTSRRRTRSSSATAGCSR